MTIDKTMLENSLKTVREALDDDDPVPLLEASFELEVVYGAAKAHLSTITNNIDVKFDGAVRVDPWNDKLQALNAFEYKVTDSPNRVETVAAVNKQLEACENAALEAKHIDVFSIQNSQNGNYDKTVVLENANLNNKDAPDKDRAEALEEFVRKRMGGKRWDKESPAALSDKTAETIRAALQTPAVDVKIVQHCSNCKTLDLTNL